MSSKFKFIRAWAKNFRSIDNHGLELKFEPGRTMIGSLDNGAGKSTMLVHVLYYVLFDKPYAKGVSKSQLINSRSNKDCVGEVEFEANGSHWVVRRGQKPTLFDIYKDGLRIEDEAALKDYQTNLSSVIGMDEKVFCNTVALGKDKFVPFVSMSAPDRRNYVEQMLDLTVFSRMNEVNKADGKQTALELNKVNSDIVSLEMKVKHKTELIDLKKKHAAEATGELESQLATEMATAASLKETRDAIDLRINANAKMFDELAEQLQQFKTLQSAIAQAEAKETNLYDSLVSAKEDGFLGTCSHCGQSMPESKAEEHREALRAQLQSTRELLARGREKLKEYPDTLQQDRDRAFNALQEAKNDKAAVDARVADCLGRIKSIKAKKEEQEKAVGWTEDEQELAVMNTELESKFNIQKELSTKAEEIRLLEVSLKDDGAKSRIINNYLPYINERINDYLYKMNLFIYVEMNSEFEIELKSPDRRGQSIQALSTGQQCRVDLASLLTWRDVANLSASCDTNILILDEVLENLSGQGVEDFMEMLRTGDASDDDMCFYVITQRVQEFEPLFDRKIIYKLVDESTRIHELD